MKTYNYEIELMVPNQSGKEVIFNEAQLKMDILSSPSVIGITDHVPSRPVAGEKYILKSLDQMNDHIVYCLDGSKGWQFLPPKEGMIKFICNAGSFVIFQNNVWQKITFASAPEATSTTTLPSPYNPVGNEEHFIGIEGKFIASELSDYFYLYVNNECVIDLSLVKVRELTMIIKQNYTRSFNISWSHNILWPEKRALNVSQNPNAMDIVKFYRLPETEHLIAEVIGQNYRF